MAVKTLHDTRLRSRAVAFLRAKDPGIAEVIARVGRCTLEPRTDGTQFDALVYAIVFQQISGKAAAAIHTRLHGLYGGRPPTPLELAETSDADLRKAGLSRQKSSYLRDLAERVESGEVPLDDFESIDDDGVERALTSVKGVGRWTAQMFLMFRLGRPDVFPEIDLGVRKGVQLVRGLEELPSPKVAGEVGEAWRPYRSVAAWYLWRGTA